MTIPRQVDVVIVGGAAIGSAATSFLAADPDFRGASLLVLEPDPAYAHCATTRSVASIRHQFSTPGNIRMSQFGTEFFRSAAQRLAVDGVVPDLAFREGGYLFLASEAGTDTLRRNFEVQRACGADVAWLEPVALRQRFPWLRVDDLAAGVLGLSGEGWIDAHSLLAALRRHAIAHGAVYRPVRAAALLREGRRVVGVRLDDGTTVQAGHVINAAGTGAAELARSVGVALPVESRRRCVFVLRTPGQLPACPLLIDPGGVYIRPEGQGFLAGVAPPAPRDPPCSDFEVDHALFDDIVWPALAHRIPALEALRVASAWAGHYDVNTFDQNLILGPHPDLDGLLFANGLSGHGLQQSPAIGRALSELVIHGTFRTLDLDAFGWRRVLDGRPLLELNVV